jgi:hypothetical protein
MPAGFVAMMVWGALTNKLAPQSRRFLISQEFRIHDHELVSYIVADNERAQNDLIRLADDLQLRRCVICFHFFVSFSVSELAVLLEVRLPRLPFPQSDTQHGARLQLLLRPAAWARWLTRLGGPAPDRDTRVASTSDPSPLSSEKVKRSSDGDESAGDLSDPRDRIGPESVSTSLRRPLVSIPDPRAFLRLPSLLTAWGNGSNRRKEM